MPDYFRAIAMDFDGALTSGGRPPDDVLLQAIADTRAAGRRAVLVTGRTRVQGEVMTGPADDQQRRQDARAFRARESTPPRRARLARIGWCSRPAADGMFDTCPRARGR